MNKLIKQTWPILLVIIGLALASCNSNKNKEGILLRYNPKVGETVAFKTVIDQSIEVQGQKMKTNISMTMDMTAIDKTDSLVTTQASIEEMCFSSDIMGQTFSFDSKHMDDADPAMAANFKDILGKTYEIVYDIYGNAVSMPEDFPNNNQGISAIFPKEMIYEGSEWTINADQTINDMSVETDATYKVKKIAKETTELELDGKLSSTLVSGTMTGTMIIDNQTGLPKTATLTMPMSMSGVSSITQTVTITTE